jgi:hypothetical protein
MLDQVLSLAGLMSDRARRLGLPTYKSHDSGASFLGSKHFPSALVESCKKHDPKAMFFGTDPVHEPIPAFEAETIEKQLSDKIGAKEFLVCFGAKDELVPYRMSGPWLDWFKARIEKLRWPVWFEQVIVPGAGHEFSPEMVRRSVDFVCDSVTKWHEGNLLWKVPGAIIREWPGNNDDLPLDI